MIFENDEISSNLSSRDVTPLYFMSDDKQDREYDQGTNTRQDRSKVKLGRRRTVQVIEHHIEKRVNHYSDETCNDGSG